MSALSGPAFVRVREALERSGSRVTGAGGRLTAQCPAHEDSCPSLSVKSIDGSVLVHCFAGCSTKAVVEALRIGLGDLFDEPGRETYRYDDGRLVHRSVSADGKKSFKQSGVTTTRPTLYRATQVIDAVAAGQVVYLVEGEKDVHAIEAAGGVATSAPMGASNIGKVDPEPLAGADVVAVVDRDEAGRKWAAQVATLLDGVASSLRCVEAATGKDAADHIAADHGLADFVPLELPMSRGIIKLADVRPERVRWLWPGRLPIGKLVVIDGDPSTGKSTLTADLAARCSVGSEWPDGAPNERPRGVLLLSAEDGMADTIVPRLISAGADLERVHALTEVAVTADDGAVVMAPPSIPRDVPRLAQIVTKHDIGLLVVDVLMAYLGGRTDSNKDQDVRSALHPLAAMAEATGCCVVLVRHLNKAGGSNALYRGGGSIGIVGAARAAYVVGRDPDDNDRRILAVSKLNIGREPESLAYRLVSDEATGSARVEWEREPVPLTANDLIQPALNDEEKAERNEVASWLVGFLSERGGTATPAEIKKAAAVEGFDWRRVQRARARLGIESTRGGFARSGQSAAYWSLAGSLPAPGV